ncbi:MAG TPA: HAD family hydrolase [Methylomirabilota bacterium]|jgi:hydroxymethylpyrimidine pyrophosphatase-like HAD family hydrolase|nr:HAD family hydrolase [Methylomirabilota bacterium]
MQFIALATDYDETLANEGRALPETLAALERFKRSGRRLVMVTGRELSDLQSVFDRLDLFDRVVAENGALLYRPETRESVELGDPPPPEFVERLRRAEIPLSVGRSIVATVEPHEKVVLDAIRDLGLELQIIFNKGAVMILPAGVNKASGLTAGLDELGLSPHNVAGIGDAENDHAFLRLCGASAAVANALPSLKTECDLVTRASRGAGVMELIDRVLEDDLKSLRRARHQVPLANTPEGETVPIEPGCVLLAAGSSGGGKSTFLLGLMERLCKQRFQYCAIDPEGDYEHVEGAVVLGTAKRPPRPSEVMELLQGVRENAIVNLVGLAFADRTAFLAELFPQLLELRTRTARPHWIVLDEAHHLLPAGHDPVALALPDRMTGLVMVTIEPKQIAPSALQRVDEILLMGRDPQALAEEFCRAVGVPAHPKLDGDLPKGTGVLWRRSDVGMRKVCLIEPKQQRKRHARKYAEGQLPEERSFFFRGPDDKLKLRAQNLTVFLQMAEGVDEETWMHHLRAGDYSRWFRDCIKDEDLAREAAAIELDGMDAEESRARIREAVERRYTAPANPS